MKTIKQTLLTGWHLMRWVRVILGVFFLVLAVRQQDSFIGLAAAFLLLTAITNVGCCGAGGCSVPLQKKTDSQPEVINFEEVKKQGDGR